MGVAFLLAICALYIIGFCFPCSYILKLDMFISMLVYIVVAILCAVLCFLLMFLAGFCMDPDKIAVNLAPEKNQNSTAFFLLCEGSSPGLVSPPLKTLRLINEFWNHNCTTTSAEDLTQQFMSDRVRDSYDTANTYITCDMTAVGWDASIHDGLCLHLFQGLFDIWVSLYASIFFLFVTMIVCSLLYQYHRKEVKEFIYADVRVAPGGDIELQQK